MRTQRHEGYESVPFPWVRVPIVDSLRAARGKHLMHALIEVDVTVPRERLRDHTRRTGESLSLTAFLIGCVAKAVVEQKGVQAVRQGARRLLVFDDVDVCTPIEHDQGEERQATPYVIRAANQKAFLAIHRELRAAQAAGIGSRWAMRARRVYPYVPRLLRAAFWGAFERFPLLGRRIGGTVLVTAVGMFGRSGWGIAPVSEYTLQVIIGSIAEKPGVIDGRLRRLIEDGYGIESEAPRVTEAIPFA